MTQGKENTSEELHGVVNNISQQRFEINVNGFISKVPYIIKDDVIALFHTEVPEELRGRGLAVKLARHALTYAKENNLKVLPYCPFINRYIKEHPEWKPLVKKFKLPDLMIWLKYNLIRS
jgi:predicted GNAT family acetyltransferase